MKKVRIHKGIFLVKYDSTSQKGGFQVKKRGVYFTFQVAIVAVIIAIVVTAVVSLGITTMDSYSDSETRLRAEAVDTALHLYSNTHKGIDSTTFQEITDAEGNKTLKYKSKRLYPDDLTSGQLTELQTKFGLISNGIRFSNAINAATPGVFKYTAVKDAVGDISKYKLEVYLSNGNLFKSPGSNAS